jgi:hypothetical protein
MNKKPIIPNPYQGLTREQVLDTMRKLLAEETRNHVLMGQLYNYLVDSKMLEGTQFNSALDYICENIQEVSRSALLMYGAVARVFTQEVCTQFGLTRLRLLLTYKDAAKIELNYTEPGGTFIQVPDEHGEVKPKLFAHCGVEALRQALMHLRKSDITPVPAEERELVDRYREAITRSFPQGTVVRVQLRNEKGSAVVDVKGIPVRQMDKLAEALLDQLYPVLEVAEVEEQPQPS